MLGSLRYSTPDAYQACPRKSVGVFGMSGLGKTTLANTLRRSGRWFHYSVDYRIGTRYMGEHIADNFKREAMKVPLLRELLLSDSVYIASNITFDNLAPLSTYLGKPGDAARGGIPFDEYVRRQRQHRHAEIMALLDTPMFRERAGQVYDYAHFFLDTGGSLCEVVDPEDPDDPVLTCLSEHVLLLHIAGTDAMQDELAARFDADPKPMYYPEDFLHRAWQDFLDETGDDPDRVDPDAFIRYGYARLIPHRKPRYDAIARNWGLTVSADEVAAIRTPDDFDRLVNTAIDRSAPRS